MQLKISICNLSKILKHIYIYIYEKHNSLNTMLIMFSDKYIIKIIFNDTYFCNFKCNKVLNMSPIT